MPFLTKLTTFTISIADKRIKKVGETNKYIMAQLVAVSIDLTKIDKTKIIEGAKGGKYINITVSVNDEEDQYGNNVALWQSQSKEEREAKEPRVFLGNGKKLWSSDAPSNSNQGSKKEHNDLPF